MEGRGYLGSFKATAIPCPKCEKEGNKTSGGYTPRLRESQDKKLYCMGTHGEVKLG